MVKSDLTVNSNRGCLINGPRGSRGVGRQSRRQQAAVWACWKGRASPPISETRANRPWQRPTAIKGPINPQLLCEGGRGRRGGQGAAGIALSRPARAAAGGRGCGTAGGIAKPQRARGWGRWGWGIGIRAPVWRRSIDPASLRSPALAERPAAGSALREAFPKGKHPLGQGPRCLLG